MKSIFGGLHHLRMRLQPDKNQKNRRQKVFRFYKKLTIFCCSKYTANLTIFCCSKFTAYLTIFAAANLLLIITLCFRKLYVLYLLSLSLCYKWKIDYMTIHIPHKKIRVGCIYCDADPVGVGVGVNTNV